MYSPIPTARAVRHASAGEQHDDKGAAPASLPGTGIVVDQLGPPHDADELSWRATCNFSN
jgi:hypothetical protein